MGTVTNIPRKMQIIGKRPNKNSNDHSTGRGSVWKDVHTANGEKLLLKSPFPDRLS